MDLNKYYNDASNYTCGAYGCRPTTTGSGTKTFTANAYAYKAFESTVISAFKDDAGASKTLGWETLTIAANQVIYFGYPIKSSVVTSGGLGEYYLAERDL